eukprot:GHVH01006009.1.p1 GENE.GHVH01006009.1~~GHVH01006009.1.p1  ORF type:complete len:777 (-),score=80.75 GHVH01006009.1:87-2417(-)
MVKYSGGAVHQAFNCPISRQLIKDPVIASDGYLYSKAALTNLLRGYDSANDAKSPVTGRPFRSRISSADMPATDVPMITLLLEDYEATLEHDAPCPLCNTQPGKAAAKYAERKEELRGVINVLKTSYGNIVYGDLTEDIWITFQAWISSLKDSDEKKDKRPIEGLKHRRHSMLPLEGEKPRRDSREKLEKRLSLGAELIPSRRTSREVQPQHPVESLGDGHSSKRHSSKRKLSKKLDSSVGLARVPSLCSTIGTEKGDKLADSPMIATTKAIKKFTRRTSMLIIHKMDEVMNPNTPGESNNPQQPSSSEPVVSAGQSSMDFDNVVEVKHLDYEAVRAMASDECGHFLALGGPVRKKVIVEYTPMPEGIHEWGPYLFQQGQPHLVTIRAIANCTKLAKLATGPPIGLDSPVSALAFTTAFPNGLAICSVDDLIILDYTTARLHRMISIGEKVSTIHKMLSLKQYLVCMSSNNSSMIIVNVDNGEVKTIKCHASTLIDICVYQAPSITKREKLRRIATRNYPPSQQLANAKDMAQEDPMIAATLSNTDHEIALWDLDTGRRLFSFPLPLNYQHLRICFPSHSNWRGLPRIITSSKTLEDEYEQLIYNFKSGRRVRAVSNDTSDNGNVSAQFQRNRFSHESTDGVELGGKGFLNLYLKDLHDERGWWWADVKTSILTVNENGANLRDDNGSQPKIKIGCNLSKYRIDDTKVSVMRIVDADKSIEPLEILTSAHYSVVEDVWSHDSALLVMALQTGQEERKGDVLCLGLFRYEGQEMRKA